MLKKNNRKRSQRELKALVDANFLKRKRNRVDESFKYGVTMKGLKKVQRGEGSV